MSNLSDFIINGTTLVKYTGSDRHVVIPNGITEIAEKAFDHCENLISVTFPEGIKSLAFGVFYSCDNLKEVYFSDSIRNVSSSCFWDSNNITKIHLGNKFCKDSAGSLKFLKLEEISIDNDNSELVVIDNVLFNKDRDELLLCGKLISGEYVIPAGVKKIGDEAFYDCEKLSKVIFPETLSEIGRSAFEYCSVLEEISIPDSVERVGGRAFWHCPSVKRIKIPSTISVIGDYAFYTQSDNEVIDADINAVKKGFGKKTFYRPFSQLNNESFLHDFSNVPLSSGEDPDTKR